MSTSAAAQTQQTPQDVDNLNGALNGALAEIHPSKLDILGSS